MEYEGDKSHQGYEPAPAYTEKSGNGPPGDNSYTAPQSPGYNQPYGQQPTGYQPPPHVGYGQSPAGYQPQPMGYGQQPYGQSYPAVHQGSAPVVVVSAAQPYVVSTDAHIYKSYAAHIALSCFVFWCCGWVLGLIAFILALVASNSESSGQHHEAEKLGKASLGVSIAGIVVGIILIIIIVTVSVINAQRIRDDYNQNYNSYNSYNG